MRHLRSGIAFEANTSLFQQFGRHREVALGLHDPPVSKVGREMGEKALNVLALTVPGNQAHNGKRVPKIVQARLEIRCRRATDTRFLTQPLKDEFGSLAFDAFVLLCSQKWRCSGSTLCGPLLIYVSSKDALQI
jgi:hypothetical protein